MKLLLEKLMISSHINKSIFLTGNRGCLLSRIPCAVEVPPLIFSETSCIKKCWVHAEKMSNILRVLIYLKTKGNVGEVSDCLGTFSMHIFTKVLFKNSERSKYIYLSRTSYQSCCFLCSMERERVLNHQISSYAHNIPYY